MGENFRGQFGPAVRGSGAPFPDAGKLRTCLRSALSLLGKFVTFTYFFKKEETL